MAGADTVIIRQTLTTEVTASDIGSQLAGDLDENQASVLLAFARSVLSWSWPNQCRNIAEQLTDEECGDVAGVLETLVEHLRTIPIERKEEEK